VRLVCVQYPLQPLAPLQKLLEPAEGVLFVDNRALFLEALQKHHYSELFNDYCYGNFGHGTPLGNRLLAENVAATILAALGLPNLNNR